MPSRQDISRVALRSALEARQRSEVAFNDPICVYDVSEKLGLEVWYVAGSSFEGMFAKGMDKLFVPSERPAGRRAFTCAHELAHWWFKHGTRVEELNFDRLDNENPEEILANQFAGYLLMAPRCIGDAFKIRNIEPQHAGPLEMYTIACQLGVGYVTLLKHLRWSLNHLDYSRMKDLADIPPKEIRRSILGRSSAGHLVRVDKQWRKVAIDLEVGDFAVTQIACSLNGKAASVIGDCSHGQIIQANHPGLAQLVDRNGTWAAMIRVSRKNFAGRGAYKHMEDTDEIT